MILLLSVHISWTFQSMFFEVCAEHKLMNNKHTISCFLLFLAYSLYFLRDSLICTMLVELIILLFASPDFFLPFVFYSNHTHSSALFHTPLLSNRLQKKTNSFTTITPNHHHIPLGARLALNSPRPPLPRNTTLLETKVFFWLLGKSKRSAVAAKSTLQTAITASSEHQSDMVSTSLFQSNANSVNQLDPEHDGADLWHLADGPWR